MECRGGRRNRRGRNHSRQPCLPFGGHNFNAQCSYQGKPRSLLNGLYSFFIMSTLMALIYLMLQHHCTTCSAGCDMNKITKNINDIAKSLNDLKISYQELELQTLNISKELPKIEGQIEILEALANTLNRRELSWDPKNHLPLPNVDVYLTKSVDGKNVSRLYPERNIPIIKSV